MEYIEREAALNQFEDSSSAIPEKWARIRIEEIPAADVVKVVRCKDCRHSAIDVMGLLYCKCVTYYNHVPEDWFCADGERKDGDGDV